MTDAADSRFARFRPLIALRHPGYRLLMSGTLPGMLAMQMSMVALSYLAYVVTSSATTLGLMGLGWGIPMLVLSLVGGVVADRFPRRTILLLTQSLLGLAALFGAALLLTGLIEVWHILIITFMQGTSFAFNMPARQAMVADLVGPHDLSNAIAFNNAVLNLTRILGPPVAGALIAVPFVGITGIFLLTVAMYVVVLFIYLRLPRTAGRPSPGARRASGWGDLKEGLRFIGQSPALLGLLLLAFAPALLGMPYQMLLPVFAVSIYQAGSEGLGLLGMANGIGALIGSVAVTFLSSHAPWRLIQTGLGLVFGVTLVWFALSPLLLAGALALVVAGAASAGYMSINTTLIMQTAPRALHGRVMSVAMMTFAVMPLMSLPVGRMADLIGASTTIAGMGVLLVAATAGLSLWERRQGERGAAGAPAD